VLIVQFAPKFSRLDLELTVLRTDPFIEMTLAENQTKVAACAFALLMVWDSASLTTNLQQGMA